MVRGREWCSEIGSLLLISGELEYMVLNCIYLRACCHQNIVKRKDSNLVLTHDMYRFVSYILFWCYRTFYMLLNFLCYWTCKRIQHDWYFQVTFSKWPHFLMYCITGENGLLEGYFLKFSFPLPILFNDLGVTSKSFGNLTPLDAPKLHSLYIFQNITMCLAKRNIHLFVIDNSNHLFIQWATFYSQKVIFKYFQEYSFRK